MSLAEHERVSSKFQVFPRSFAFWPNIDLSVNFLAVDFISRHTSRLKGFIYKLIKYMTCRGVILKATGYVLWQVVFYQCVILPQSPCSILY